MNASVATAMNIFGYNTWLFGSALKDVTAEHSAYRVHENTNSFDRLAGHITVARRGLGTLLGMELPDLGWGEFEKAGERGRQFDPNVKCPPISDIMEGFNRVTDVMMAKLPDVSNDTLAKPSPFPVPGDNPTLADLLSFLAMHESYHIGQLGLLKKCMTGRRIMDR